MDALQQFRRCKYQLPQALDRAASQPRGNGAPFPARGIKVGHTGVASNHEPPVFGASRQSNPKVPYPLGRSRAPRANGVAARLVVVGQFLEPLPTQAKVFVHRPRGQRECQLQRYSSNKIACLGTKGLVRACVGIRAGRPYTLHGYNFKVSSSLRTLRLANQHRCSLTPRSSGAPTACHRSLAGCGTRRILAGQGPAASRRRPLTSNVRRRKTHCRWASRYKIQSTVPYSIQDRP
jgi:hypothetical protein